MCLRGNYSAHGRLLLVDPVNNPSLVRSVGVQFWLLPCTRIELEFEILEPPVPSDPFISLYHVPYLNYEPV